MAKLICQWHLSRFRPLCVADSPKVTMQVPWALRRCLVVVLLALLAVGFAPPGAASGSQFGQSSESIGFTYDTPGSFACYVDTAAGLRSENVSTSRAAGRRSGAATGRFYDSTSLFVAPSGLGGLGDDFTRALDDIDNAVPRPNVRNPKPFTNDGRGGTTRLPELDTSSNPITYVEHTVNPRPPGGSLDGSRIVTGTDGSVWATTDHFQTWTRVR